MDPQQGREKALLCGGVREGTSTHSGFDMRGRLRADELSDGNEGVGMGGPRCRLPSAHYLLCTELPLQRGVLGAQASKPDFATELLCSLQSLLSLPQFPHLYNGDSSHEMVRTHIM